MPRAGNSGLAKDCEHLAAAAAQIEHRRVLAEARGIHALARANVFFGAAKSVGELEPVDVREFRRRALRHLLHGARERRPLPQQAELGMDHALIIQTHSRQLVPKPPMNLFSLPFRHALVIGVLRAQLLPIFGMLCFQLVAETGVHQRDAMLKRGLQFGNAAQELNLGLRELLFPAGVPLDTNALECP